VVWLGHHVTVTQSCQVWRETSTVNLYPNPNAFPPKCNRFFCGPCSTFPPNFVKISFCVILLTNKQSESITSWAEVINVVLWKWRTSFRMTYVETCWLFCFSCTLPQRTATFKWRSFCCVTAFLSSLLTPTTGSQFTVLRAGARSVAILSVYCYSCYYYYCVTVNVNFNHAFI